MSLKTTVPEAEARLVRLYYDPQTATIRLIRKWTDIDATVADTLTAALPGSVSGPKADGQTYSGDFEVNQNIAEGQDDRSVTITQTLIKQGNAITIIYAENCDTLVELQYYFGMSITDAEAKIEEYATSIQGRTVTPRIFPISENEVNLVLEIKVRRTRATGQMWVESTGLSSVYEIKQNGIYNVYAVPDSVPGVAYRQNVRWNDDCTYDAETTYRKSEPGYLYYRSKTSPVDVEDEALYRNSMTPVVAPEAVRGIYRVSQRMNDDETYDATLTYMYGRPVDVYYKARMSKRSFVYDTIYRNSLVPIEAPLPVYGVYNVNQRINDDKTYDATLTYQLPNLSGERVDFPSLRSALLYEDTSIYRSMPYAVNAPNVTLGVYRANNSFNEDGTYDATLAYRSAKASTITLASSLSPFGTQDTALYRNSPYTVYAPRPAVGLYRTTLTPNEDGTYEASIVYSTPYGNGLYFKYSGGTSRLVYEDNIVYPSLAAPIDAPLAETKGIYSVSNTLREDGTYQASLMYRRTRASVAAWSWRTNRGTAAAMFYSNYPVLVDDPWGNIGYNYSVSLDHSVNQDGTYNIKSTYTPVQRSANGSGSDGDAWDDVLLTWPYTNGDGQSIRIYRMWSSKKSDVSLFLNGSSPYLPLGTIIGSDSGTRTGADYGGRGRFIASRVERI